MRIALLQTCSGDDPQENLGRVTSAIDAAARQGAALLLTPEVVNCLSHSRRHQQAVLHRQADDPMLAAAQRAARQNGMMVLLGSLALKTNDADGRFANRSILIGPEGDILACYDKIHMFDVRLSGGETYRESKSYRPGHRAVVVPTALGVIGMTICYDLRFPYLFRALARAGAAFITVPAAFARQTGKAHWEVLLRARAIETGCFVLAPAQTGQNTPKRATHGHSMVVAPWGEVLLDAGIAPGLYLVDIDPAEVGRARTRVPSLFHTRDYDVQP